MAQIRGRLAAAAWNRRDGGELNVRERVSPAEQARQHLAESAEGQRPQRLAYQIVPPPHASVPSMRKAAQEK
jgi:hypothetical protein